MLHDKYDVVLVIDESGSLGFSTKQEQTPGQFGLIAGYLIPFSKLNDAKVLAKSYFQEFKQEDEKIHITDLPSEHQNKIRQIVFKIFSSNEAVWFYEAISVQGFYEFHKNESKERLHTKLVFAIFLKVLAYLRTLYKENRKLDLLILTDRLDVGVLKEFDKEIKNNLFMLTSLTKVIRFKYRDEKEKIIKEAENKITIEYPDGMKNILFDRLSVTIKDDISDITLIADVLANSAYYYINREVEKDPNIDLNEPSSIKNHPLFRYLWGNKVRSILDDMYRRIR